MSFVCLFVLLGIFLAFDSLLHCRDPMKNVLHPIPLLMALPLFFFIYFCFNFHRLIIACRYHPLPILKEAIVLLAPSSPFVVYCEYMEPLVECFTYLHQESLAVRLHITDTWMREFQTLPGRVHPEMHMTTSAGFVLTGIYVGLIPQLQQAETIVQVDKKDNGNTKRKRRN